MNYRIAAVFVALAIGLPIALIPSRVNAAEPRPCRLDLMTSLDMQPDMVGRPIVPVKINGRDARFLVDTGAVHSMIAHQTMNELQLPTRRVPLEFRSLRGDRVNTAAAAKSFEVGRLPLGKFSFMILPQDFTLPGAQGLLGPDVMHAFDIELDFGRRKLNIFRFNNCDGNVVYWTTQPYAVLPISVDSSWHIGARAKLDDAEINVVIDTGASYSVMFIPDAERLYGIKPGREGLRPIPDAPDRYYYPFRSLNLEGMAIQNPAIVLRPNTTGIPLSRIEELILGMSVLSKLHLYIAYRDRKIYITPSSAR